MQNGYVWWGIFSYVNIAVLVGGKGGRIGREKGLLELCGKTFLEIILNKFEDCSVVIVCRDEKQAEIYSKFGRTIIDVVKNYGPLGGILSALEFYREKTLVIAVDMPLVKRRIAEYLYSLPGDVVVPSWGDGKIEPLFACYSEGALKAIRECVRRGEKRVHVAIRMMNANYVSVMDLKRFDPDLQSFLNVNSPKDYERLKRVVECS